MQSPYPLVLKPKHHFPPANDTHEQIEKKISTMKTRPTLEINALSGTPKAEV